MKSLRKRRLRNCILFIIPTVIAIKLLILLTTSLSGCSLHQQNLFEDIVEDIVEDVVEDVVDYETGLDSCK